MNDIGTKLSSNRILACLPASELEQLRPKLQRTSFVLQQVLHDVGKPIQAVYFIESGLISVTADTQDNGLVEVGMIGREGFTGGQVLLYPNGLAIHRSFVQIPGEAHVLQAEDFQDALQSLPVFREQCQRTLHFLMVQTSQTAACNARHELPERLARWLLMSHDRMDGNTLPMKQEFLSYMLGVRRAGVSTVVGGLQEAGLIRTARGQVTIVDRDRLEDEACSCYEIIERSRQEILG
jgi:CRP-like cAMP-binding protein